MPNYTKLAATARRLVEASGRPVNLIKLDPTGESGKPWDGPADPRATPADSLDCHGVFVPPGSGGLGAMVESNDLFKTSQQICILTVDAGTWTMDALEAEELVDEDGTYWRVNVAQELKPASSALLWFVGVSR